MNPKKAPVKLKSYIKQLRGIAFKPQEISDVPFEGSIAILKANNITENGLDVASLIFIDTKKVKDAQLIRSGDILLAASSGSKKVIGKNIYFPENYNGSFGAFCKLVRPMPGLHPGYLKHFFKTRYYRNFIEKSVQGANINNLKNEHLDNLEILLPLLDEQIRIAHFLGEVERLVAQRKQHLQQLDDLIKSVFIKMFGDPVRNEKGWTKQPFYEILSDIESGKSPKCEARVAAQDEWGVLKLSAITSCFFQENKSKALPANVEPQVKHEIKSGDLLFSRKNTRELVSACTYVFNTRPKLLMPDLIFRFVFKEDVEVNPIYVWKLLTSSSQRKKIQSLAAGAAGSMPNISKGNLKQALLPLPPFDLQNQFAAIVEKVEGIKIHYQKSLAELENLYGALSQKAFKGELDLSRMPLSPITNLESPEMENDSQPLEVETVETEAALVALDQPAMGTAEGRLRLLQQWFLNWLQNAEPSETLSVQMFWQEAQLRALDYEDENDDDTDFMIAEYDQFKQWLFEAIENGQIQQTQNIVSELGKEIVLGNKVILKKAQ